MFQWQVTAGPFIAASGCFASSGPLARAGIGGASWVGSCRITPLQSAGIRVILYKKSPWVLSISFHTPEATTGEEKTMGKPWFLKRFFLIQKLIVETSFCALLVPNLDQGFSEAWKPAKTCKNQPFGPTRPIHPQISPNSIKEVYYDVYCFKVANFISGWPFKTAPQKKTGRPSLLFVSPDKIRDMYWFLTCDHCSWWSFGYLLDVLDLLDVSMASDCRTFHRSIRLLRIVRTTCRGWHRRCLLNGKLSNYPTTKCWN